MALATKVQRFAAPSSRSCAAEVITTKGPEPGHAVDAADDLAPDCSIEVMVPSSSTVAISGAQDGVSAPEAKSRRRAIRGGREVCQLGSVLSGH